jgi:zinc transport system substrate-binding protein
MARALARKLPGQAEAIAARRDSLLTDLDDLDAHLTELLAPVRGRTMLVFHPAFGYFARDYGLQQRAMETGGLAPGPRHLAELMRTVEEIGVHTVFIQPQQSDQAARTLAREAGLEVVVLDPLARDHLANLRRLGEKVRAGLEGGS